MKNSKEDLETIFLDVRKAYRLLFAYQSRVLDIIKFIGNELNFTYQGGHPKYSDLTPRSGKGTLENWAWDWLNIYCYGFNFKDKIISENETFRFSAILVSDTGFYDFETNPNHQNKKKLINYNEPNDSETKLILVYGKNGWVDDIKGFEKIYKKGARPIVEVFEYGILVAKSYPLSSFADADCALDQINDFVTYCIINGLTEIKPLEAPSSPDSNSK
ncbi:hypothetical protein [Litoribacter populi]|uniref:hypothetical protein n=1 Tax=Litoribacter populi TaxID=2598460 RepID=UPI00117F2A56|nr:hypothetical protein [Litoribacter populi]